jgi:hypothetical protein
MKLHGVALVERAELELESKGLVFPERFKSLETLKEMVADEDFMAFVCESVLELDVPGEGRSEYLMSQGPHSRSDCETSIRRTYQGCSYVRKDAEAHGVGICEIKYLLCSSLPPFKGATGAPERAEERMQTSFVTAFRGALPYLGEGGKGAKGQTCALWSLHNLVAGGK